MPLSATATTSTRPPHKALLLLSSLFVLAMISIAAALFGGSVPLEFAVVWQALSGDGDSTAAAIVQSLRLPRALTAFSVGGLLALAGCLMQVLLRNPLADPYVLGTSGGAATAALCAMLLGLGTQAFTLAAFGGALFSVLLVFGLARSKGNWSSTRLLLTGVVTATGWSAIIAFLLTISPDRLIRGMLFWLMGDLSGADRPYTGLIALLLLALFAFAIARPLNLMARGELQAGALGVAVVPLRYALYLLAALATAIAVTLAGSIGFVGLVIPHLLRLVGARDHRILLPAAILAGGSLLVWADLLARTLLAPQQLPVGILTAFIGVPLFLFLLQRTRTGVHA